MPTLCPLAIVAGCKKCPIVACCPLKSVLGDYNEKEQEADASHGACCEATGAKEAEEKVPEQS